MDKKLLAEANEWLEAHAHQALMIQKEEQGNLDQVRLTLEHVAFRPRRPGGDSYTNSEALLLQGSGTIINGEEELSLPQDTFVVPVHGLKSMSRDEKRLMLETERARYTFTLQS